VVAFLAWVGLQLDDPTRTMHALGIATVGGEVLRHFLSGHAVDPSTIAAGVGCFTVGGVIDHYQGKKSK